MQHVVTVRIGERICDLAGDLHRVLDGQLLLAVEPIPERLTLDVGHDVVEETVGLPAVMQPEDVRVCQLGGDCDFAEEPLFAEAAASSGRTTLTATWRSSFRSSAR